MYTVILFFLSTTILFLFINYRTNVCLDIEHFITSLFDGLFGAFAGLIVALALPVKYETVSYKINIVALNDNSGLSESFFLCSGIVDSRMRYIFYSKNYDSTFQMYQVDYTESKIKYTTNTPSVTINRTHRKDCYFNRWAIDFFFDESKESFLFEIPEGSIKTQYKLDAN